MFGIEDLKFLKFVFLRILWSIERERERERERFLKVFEFYFIMQFASILRTAL